MAELIKLRWDPSPASGLSSTDRRGCDYEAYVPDPLIGRRFSLSGETAAAVADAERAIERLNRHAEGLADSEALARLLLRAEAVASSRIEGLEVGARRLLQAQAAVGTDAEASDVTATEVLNNVEAMQWAVDTLAISERFDIDLILGIHARLMSGTRLEQYAGQVRDVQNWIGGSEYNPCSAAFVPPPSDRVQALLEDLCQFCNDDGLPPLVQAALAHAQFETIHPFVDGNGRTGRALIHAILRLRRLAPVVVPPISLALATWSKDYVNGLMSTRSVGDAESPTAVEATDDWIALFAAATRRAVADAGAYETQVADLQSKWRARLGRVRADSAVDRLLHRIPAAPIVTVESAAALIGRSQQAVNEAIPRLVEAGVLAQTTLGRRNRAFEATELIDAFTDLERQLASPEGDTRFSPPRRRVPHRRAP